MTPKYKRILLKLSGEALMGEDPFGINRQRGGVALTHGGNGIRPRHGHVEQ